MNFDNTVSAVAERVRDEDTEQFHGGESVELDKPIVWDKRSWSQDAADYILPDSDDDMAELGDIIRSALLSSEINIIGKATVGGAVSVSFWCSRIGEIVLQAAIDNELKYDALSGLKS